MVPLIAAKRDYVLLPGGAQAGTRGAGPGARGIGMDDPALAQRLGATALDAGAGERPEALTYRIVADGARGGPGRAGAAARGAADRPARPLDILLQAARAERHEEPQRNPLRELLVTMLLTSVGVAAAYHLSHNQGLDPTLWVGAGGMWGLILGWLCIRWMRQRQ